MTLSLYDAANLVRNTKLSMKEVDIFITLRPLNNVKGIHV